MTLLVLSLHDTIETLCQANSSLHVKLNPNHSWP